MLITCICVPLRGICKGYEAGNLPTMNEIAIKEIRTLFAAKWPELQIRYSMRKLASRDIHCKLGSLQKGNHNELMIDTWPQSCLSLGQAKREWKRLFIMNKQKTQNYLSRVHTAP